MVLAVGGSVVIGLAVKAFIGFRPDAEAEEDGLDQTDHGEAGYHLDFALGSVAAHDTREGLGSAEVATSKAT